MPASSDQLSAFSLAGGPTAARTLDAAGNLVNDGAGSAYDSQGRLIGLYTTTTTPIEEFGWDIGRFSISDVIFSWCSAPTCRLQP